MVQEPRGSTTFPRVVYQIEAFDIEHVRSLSCLFSARGFLTRDDFARENNDERVDRYRRGRAQSPSFLLLGRAENVQRVIPAAFAQTGDDLVCEIVGPVDVGGTGGSGIRVGWRIGVRGALGAAAGWFVTCDCLASLASSSLSLRFLDMPV